jgi:hypothetical protein
VIFHANPHLAKSAGPDLRIMSGPADYSLDFHPFNHAERRFGGHNSRKFESGFFVEFTELYFRTLSAASHHQHVEIDELAEVWFAGGRDYGFNQDQFAVLGQRAMTILQNRD